MNTTIDDPLFGRLRWSGGEWKGSVDIPVVGGKVPLSIDVASDDVEDPSDDQRTIFQEFLQNCDEQFVRRVEESLFNAVRDYQTSDWVFGMQKAAADKVQISADIWTTVHNLRISVLYQDEPVRYLALQWAADWEDEHGVQVLYREGGDIQVGAIGECWYDGDPQNL